MNIGNNIATGAIVADAQNTDTLVDTASSNVPVLPHVEGGTQLAVSADVHAPVSGGGSHAPVSGGGSKSATKSRTSATKAKSIVKSYISLKSKSVVQSCVSSKQSVSSKALSRVEAKEEHVKEQAAIDKRENDLALEELELETKRKREEILLKGRRK